MLNQKIKENINKLKQTTEVKEKQFDFSKEKVNTFLNLQKVVDNLVNLNKTFLLWQMKKKSEK
jgi:hypothetical protein